jgi:hypothetical protein
MSLARLKRIAALEARKPKAFVSVDYAAAAASLCWVLACHAAVAANKASLMPVYGPPREPTPAMAEAMRHLDRMAARLEAERKGALGA